MKWTRRAMLGAAGAVALASPALAQGGSGDGLRVRRNAATLAPNDPDLQALARAMQLMNDRSDTLSWQTQVDIHGTYWGQHGTWRFLPWHRVQLHWFERIVGALSGKPDFAMPYWDWQDTGRLPPLFTDPSSPFYHEPRNPDLASFDFVRERERQWGGAWANVFQGSFDSFVGRKGASGAVETSGHSYVHVMVGGDMSDPATAPYDPLFWFHHCNIDRVWAAWQKRAEARGVAMKGAWLGESFDNFVDETGQDAQPKSTEEVRYPERLNYRYDQDYPFKWFDEQPMVGPPGKTPHVVGKTPYRFALTAEPGVKAPLRLPLPADLVALLGSDTGSRFQVSGVGEVRTTDMSVAGSAFQLTVESFRKDGSIDTKPMAYVLPFIGEHGAAQPGAAPMAMAGMAPAPAAARRGPYPRPGGKPMPSEHGFSFTLGPEIYDATGAPAVEIAAVATSKWVKTSSEPAPSISGLELDLIVTEYAWS